MNMKDENWTINFMDVAINISNTTLASYLPSKTQRLTHCITW